MASSLPAQLLLVILSIVPAGCVVFTGVFWAHSWIGELCACWSAQSSLLIILGWLWWWRLALAHSYQPRWHLMWALVMIAAWWPLSRAWWSLPSLPRVSASVAERSAFRVVSANMFDFNAEREQSITSLAALDGAVVSLQEVTGITEDDLRMRCGLPYQVWSTDRILLKVALGSRFPIAWSAVHDALGNALIEAELTTPDGPVRVLVVHAYSPKSPRAAWHRTRQLALVAQIAAARPGPLLIMGDLNTSQTSPGFADFCATADVARGTPPWIATWPAWLGPLGIGIDHLLGRQIAITDAHPAPIAGSDHRALSALVKVESAN